MVEEVDMKEYNNKKRECAKENQYFACVTGEIAGNPNQTRMETDILEGNLKNESVSKLKERMKNDITVTSDTCERELNSSLETDPGSGEGAGDLCRKNGVDATHVLSNFIEFCKR